MSRCDAKARDATSVVSCEVSCRVCSLNGVGAYKACHRRRAMSPCPVEYSCIPGCGSSSVSSRLKRPSVCSPVLPVNDSLERDQIVHVVAGVPLSSIRIDCRLVGPFGCDVGCSCSSMERRHNLCFFQFASERSVSRMSYGGSSSPTPWKRGSPLAPVVVVGEGQVNLGVRPWLVSGPWSKSPKLCG